MKNTPAWAKTAMIGGLGALLFTACSTTQTEGDWHSKENRTSSRLSFSPVSDPVELVKWHSTFPGMRSIETYVLTAPAEEPVSATGDLPEFSENLEPGSVFVEAAGAEASPKRVILHTPHQR